MPPISPASDGHTNLERIRQQDLRSSGILRPLLPEEPQLPEVRAGPNEKSFNKFKQALATLQGAGKHSVDLFE